MQNNFVHLHLHTDHSPLDGFGSPEAYAERAKEMGFKAIAVTDHGNIDAALKMEKACSARSIQFIAGCELYIDSNRHTTGNESSRRHLNVWAKNSTGWYNIMKMLTIGHLEGFVKRPRIDPSVLLRHSDGLCFGTACMGGFIGTDWGVKLLEDLSKKHPGDVYVEIMPHDWENQNKWNKKAIKIAKKNGIKLIATNDAHYINQDDAILQEILLAVGTHKTWDDPKRWRFECDTLFMCDKKWMIKAFKKYHPYISRDMVKEAIENTNEVAAKCADFSIPKQEVKLPLIKQCEEGSEDQFFWNLVKEGLKVKIKSGQIDRSKKKEYRSRINEEMDLLVGKGFSRYFLIVWELIEWCREQRIVVGPGRGSVGGSLVAWLIGITDVDPLKYGLYFSRFISAERNDLPDIDLDFDRDKRDQVLEHIRNIYGRDNVVQISTFYTMKGKSAIKDVGRVFGLEMQDMNAINKLIDDKEDLTVETFTESDAPELKAFYRDHSDVVEYAVRMQGTVRGYGKHAAGVCISDQNLKEGLQCNLAKRNNVIVSNWDKDDCEAMGLMKLDILGLSALSRQSECLDNIMESQKKNIRLTEVDLEDPGVLSDLSSGLTEGVFQLGTYGITKFCQELEVDQFKDIYDASALFRPGTLRSGMAKEFIERKHGKPWKAIHKNVAKLTENTYGIIVYQEQVMMLANKLAGMDMVRCNQLRKVIAKSKGVEAIEEYRKEFVDGCTSSETLSNTQANELFNIMIDFSKYAFNLSHSVQYSIISYWDAWLKHHYPAEFYASCLSYLDLDKRNKILERVVEDGLQVMLPKQGISKATSWVPRGNTLYMPINSIIGIGEKTAEQIYKDSKKKQVGFFTSSSTFKAPVKAKKVLELIHFSDKDHVPTYNQINKIREYFEYDLYDLFE